MVDTERSDTDASTQNFPASRLTLTPTSCVNASVVVRFSSVLFPSFTVTVAVMEIFAVTFDLFTVSLTCGFPTLIAADAFDREYTPLPYCSSSICCASPEVSTDASICAFTSSFPTTCAAISRSNLEISSAVRIPSRSVSLVVCTSSSSRYCSGSAAVNVTVVFPPLTSAVSTSAYSTYPSKLPSVQSSIFFSSSPISPSYITRTSPELILYVPLSTKVPGVTGSSVSSSAAVSISSSGGTCSGV